MTDILALTHSQSAPSMLGKTLEQLVAQGLQ